MAQRARDKSLPKQEQLNGKAPYTDQELENAVLLSFENCYKKKPDNNPKNQSPITYYLGYKSYSAAVKKKRLVIVEWIKGKGYRITPTEKIKGQGYTHLNENEVFLKEIKTPGELGRIFREVSVKSTITSE